MRRLDREAELENAEVEDVNIGENTGLMRVLNNKQKEIDNLKNKISKIEENNNRLDLNGKVKHIESMDFEFDLQGNSIKENI